MKLIDSRANLIPLEIKNQISIDNYLKIKYKCFSTSHTNNTVTFYSTGIIEIDKCFYNFNCERTYEHNFKDQDEHDIFIQKTLKTLDNLLLKGFGATFQTDPLN